MIGVDTNVLLRFLVDDHPEQNRLARAFLSERDARDPIFVCAVTLAETVWLLSRGLGYSTKDIRQLISELLASEGVVMEHAERLGMLLASDVTIQADIAGYLIAWAGSAAGARGTLTFDRRAAATVPGMELLQ